MPAFFNSEKGFQAAATQSYGKLAIAAGVIIGRLSHLEIELVHVTAWKGQMPKAVMRERVHAIFPERDLKADAYDAVGIGLYVLGRF